MRIGIDGRVLDRQMTGTGRYLLNLLNEIPKIDNKNDYYVFINNKKLLDQNFFKTIPVKESFLPSKIYSSWWLNFVLPGEIKKYNLDIFFTCNIILPVVKLGGAKKITVVHDVIHKVDKAFYPASYRLYLNSLLPITFKSADKVISASEHSKKDIIKYFKVKETKVDVLYTAAKESFKENSLNEEIRKDLLKRYELPEKFLLYVGVIEERKNISGLFKIAEELAIKNIGVPIVMVGRPGYGFEDIENKVKLYSGRVIYLNFVDDKDLPLLYNLAKVFVFPSFYEGFGIPPLEAMQSGTPVVSSDTGSLPEVLDYGAILLPPNDIKGFVAAIGKLMEDDRYYKTWKEKGLKRASDFNMTNSVTKLVQIFNSFKNSK